jgi:cation transporter-like permease
MTKNSWVLFLLWILSGIATGYLVSEFFETGNRSFPELIAVSAITALATTAIIIQKASKALRDFKQKVEDLFNDQ